MRKPELEIYKLTLRSLGVKPNQVIFVDDKEKNILAADRIGIRGILFRSSAQAIGDVTALLS